ncbi:MAG TPA: hypothetical protein VME24_07885, partial [Alphaproteobacteria bacterium]|nr:hypothetical protein [Alphaproteobacteria bacterium]
MNQRYIMFQRAGVFYCEDTTTGKQLSLRTKNETEAITLLHSKNESVRQPKLNLQIAKTYLAAADDSFIKRTWPEVMDALTVTLGRNGQSRRDAGKICAGGVRPQQQGRSQGLCEKRG